MSDLTENEIIDCLRTNFRLAAEHCEALAVMPARGPTYSKLRAELKLVEGACRQIAHCRGDARWLQIGLMVEEAHQRAGFWLRKHHPRPLFVKLSEALRHGQKRADELRLNATGRVGLILPKPLPGPHRDTRPVQVMSPGGVLLPHA